jgi:hypothetical protein
VAQEQKGCQEMTNHPTYLIDDFIDNTEFHLVPILKRKKLARNQYKVSHPFIIEDKKGFPFFFDEGFVSDGGSIPWFLWPFLRYNGKAMPAFLIHDAYCDEATKEHSYLIRQIGDGNIYRHLRDCGVANWIAKSASKAVKNYGLMLKAKGDLK